MSEPARLAEKLTDGTDLAAASLLVTLYFASDPIEIPAEHRFLVDQLTREGCLAGGRCTPLGSMVAMRLEASGLFGERQA